MTILSSCKFTLEESKHTKTGEDIFIARATITLERDEYKALEKEIKALGGYYSRFVSGFIFKADPSDKLNITDEAPVKKTRRSSKAQKQVSLFDLTRVDNIEKEEKDIAGLDTKEIAKIVKKELKDRFPFVKFSVTSTYNSVDFKIKESPFEFESKILQAINTFASKLIGSYKYCTCYDPYGDYGSSYNFYGGHSGLSSYDYKQNDKLNSLAEVIAQFDKDEQQHEAAEQEKRDREFEEAQKKMELDRQEREKEEKENNQRIEEMKKDIVVKDIPENNQYIVEGVKFAKLNKNNRLEQYQAEVDKGEYNTDNIIVKRELHFTDEKALEVFSNNLLTDFDFLSGQGGSYTPDNRINDVTDYYNMTKEEQSTVEWFNLGVAIYLDGELQYIADPQGYNYVRYIGLVGHSKTFKAADHKEQLNQMVGGEELAELKSQADKLQAVSDSTISDLNINDTWTSSDWKGYRVEVLKRFKASGLRPSRAIAQQVQDEGFKTALYKLLKETDSVQDQFREADIKPEQKITILTLGGVFGGVVTDKMTVESINNSTYAQYTDVVEIIHTSEGKKTRYKGKYYGEMIVYKGWIELPESLFIERFMESNGTSVERTRFGSYDNQQLDIAIEYLDQQGQHPIINTYKPMF